MENTLEFAQEWQRLSRRNAIEAQVRLAQEGIWMMSPEKALEWETLRNDMRQAYAEGDDKLAQDLGMEMDDIMMLNDMALGVMEKAVRTIFGPMTLSSFPVEIAEWSLDAEAE